MSKFKFKVGDKVKTSWFASIKSNTADDRWAVMTGWMEKLVGEEGIILTTEDYYGIPRYELSNGWMWPESGLTLVEDKNQFKPGDKVNACIDNVRWSISDIFYVGRDRRGRYVIENKDGDLSSWEYCRPFKEKTTYNVWQYQDSDRSFLAIKGSEPQPTGEWKMVHTFTI